MLLLPRMVAASTTLDGAAFVTAETTRVNDLVERVAAVLRSHNIEAIVVDTADQARETVLGIVPDRAEVHSGKSRTLEEVGLYRELMESGRYDAVRPKV